jgi:hypothetical protein
VMSVPTSPKRKRGNQFCPSLALYDVALFGLTKWSARGFSALKGSKHISPGQRPGCTKQREAVALKGHNKFAASAVCTALSGLGTRFASDTRGVAPG